MKFLRSWLGLDDLDHQREATATTRQIEEARREYARNLKILESRKNNQAVGNSQKVMAAWGGAMRLLREDER